MTSMVLNIVWTEAETWLHLKMQPLFENIGSEKMETVVEIPHLCMWFDATTKVVQARADSPYYGWKHLVGTFKDKNRVSVRCETITAASV